MCCCQQPNVNGQGGYRWNSEDANVHPVNPPALNERDQMLYDEPGRCGGLDSHAYHYRVVASLGSLFLLVRHGAGQERLGLSCLKTLVAPLAAMDSTTRYWMLNAIFHAHRDAARDAHEAEAEKWRRAAAEKRIKTRRLRGAVKVWIQEADNG